MNSSYFFSKTSRIMAFSVVFCVSGSATIMGGLMSHLIDVQVYRDFAENRGRFAAGATDVPIYDKQGNLVGTIPLMMNFDSLVDNPGKCGAFNLTGGPSFLATVAHNGNDPTVTFTYRFGATKDTPFYDEYRVISNHEAWTTPQGSTNTGSDHDYAVQRLSKIVTEAEAVPFLTDQSILENIDGRLLLRVGGGIQNVAVGRGQNEGVGGGYDYLTGGTIRFTETLYKPANGEEQTPDDARTYDAYTYRYYSQIPTEEIPLDIGIQNGDSGSPVFIYNENTGRWEFVAAAQSGGGFGYGIFNQLRSCNEWGAAVISGYDQVITTVDNGGDIIWSITDANGQGTISQGGNSTTYTGLTAGLRGDTSTVGTLASNEQLDAAKNLIFDGNGGTIVIQGDIDTGAGSLTFNGNYTLTDGGDVTRQLNTAGYIVNEGVMLTTTLTGNAGDEWRKIGDGDMLITGHGENLADLNVGGRGTTFLAREGGHAIHDVIINGGGATVVTVLADQISGDIIFGHRGGTLDMYGNDMSADHITHLDDGATFANYKNDSVATFTFTGSGAQSYLGGFTDGQSHANGLLNVVYNPETANGSVWHLSGVNTNKGTWQVNGGELLVQGTYTLHAGGYIDENDWQTAYFETGTVSVAGGARFTSGYQSIVTSDITLSDNATYANTGGAHLGNISVASGTGTILADIGAGRTGVESGAITGNVNFIKTGEGTLRLENGDNSFTGNGQIVQGMVEASCATALGAIGQQWDIQQASILAVHNATFDQTKHLISTNSTGTYALVQDTSQDPGLAGYGNLFLGAIGDIELGISGTTDTLSGWTSDGGWNLGGGGGDLSLNLKLSGNGTLNVGNGFNTGTVTLTNIHNSDNEGSLAFLGQIVVNQGTNLRYTDNKALGLGTILVEKGSRFSLNQNDAVVLSHIDTASNGVISFTGIQTSDYDLNSHGLHDLYIGVEGEATFRGNITAGNNGYLFGGSGIFNMESVLSGTGGLTVDSFGEGAATMILTADNTYSGVTRILGTETVLQVGNGGTTGSLGNGDTVNESVLAFNRSDTYTYGGAITGSGQLWQVGEGATILSGNSVYTGDTIIEAGTLQIGDSGMTGSLGTGNIINNSSLVFNRSGSLLIGNLISGSGTLAFQGGGTYILDRYNTFNGTTTVGNGTTLELARGGREGSLRGTVTVEDGGILLLSAKDATGYSTTVGTINILEGGLLNATAGRDQSWGGTTVNLTGGHITGTGNIQALGNLVFNTYASSVSSVIDLSHIKLRQGNADQTIFNVARYAGGDSNYADLIIAARIEGGSATNAGQTLVKKGAGTMALTRNDNSFVANFRVEGGTLMIGDGGTNGVFSTNTAATLEISSGGTVAFNRSNDFTFTNTISGTGKLVKMGAGTLTLGGDISGFTGGIDISAGSLVFNRSGNLTLANMISGSGQLAFGGGGTYTLNKNNTFSGTTTIRNGTTLELNRGGSQGGLRGHVIVEGGGILRLTAVDALGYGSGTGVSELTILQGGIVDAANTIQSSSTGGMQMNLTGGNITGAGFLRVNNSLVINTYASSVSSVIDASNIELYSGNSEQLTFNVQRQMGAASDYADLIIASGIRNRASGTKAQTLVKQGAGIMALTSNDNSFNAHFRVEDGTLMIGDGGTNGVFSTNNAATLEISSGGTVAFNRSGNLLIGNMISGNGTLTFMGNGTYTLNQHSSFNGTTTIGNGTTLEFAAGGREGSLRGIVTVESGGTLLLSAKDAKGYILGTAVETINILQGGVVNATAGRDQSWSNSAINLTGGHITGTGNIQALDNLVFNTYASSESSVIDLSHINLRKGNADETIFNVARYAGGDSNYADLIIASKIQGGSATGAAQTLVKRGAGMMALTRNDNSFAANFRVEGGTLMIGDGGTNGVFSTNNAATLELWEGSQLIINRSDDYTMGNAISGAGQLVKWGGGTFTLGGDISGFTGGIDISAGSLVFDRSGTLTIANLISGNGQLNFTGTGHYILDRNNTFSGTTTVNNGTTLELIRGGSQGGLRGHLIVENGSTLRLSAKDALGYGGGTKASELTVHQGGTIDAYTNQDQSWGTMNVNLTGADIIGAGNIQALGGLVFNTYASSKESTIRLSHIKLRENDTQQTVFNVQRYAGASADYADLIIATDIFGGSATSRAQTLVKQGTGTMALTDNDNNFNAHFRVEQGALMIGNGGTTGVFSKINAATLELWSGTRLIINRSNNYAMGNTVTGAGKLVKTGTGTLTLGGVNSFTGGVDILAGRLVVGGNQSLGTGMVTIDNGGILSLNGSTLGNDIIVNAGGIMEGGGTLAGNVSFASGSFYDVTIGSDLSYNQLFVTGGLSISDGATLRINFLDIGYDDIYWTQNQIFTIALADAGITIEGLFGLDASLTGDHSGMGSWSISMNAEGNTITLSWEVSDSAVQVAPAGMPLRSSGGGPLGGAIPEPSTAVLLSLMAGVSMFRRKRRLVA